MTAFKLCAPARVGLAGSFAASSDLDDGTPPYSLPTVAGQVVKIGTNRAVDVALPGWNAFAMDFSLRVSFGAGTMQPEYSPRGAYVWAGCGGHAHPDIAGAVLFDYQDATWKRFEHTNGGTQYATLDGTRGFKLSQMNGVPHYEITDTITTEGGITYAVPGPVHPYQMLTVWPSAYGGGDKGGVAYVTRATMGEGGMTHSPSTHGLNLTTMKWQRFPNLATRDPISSGRFEGAVVWDEARARWWLWHEDMFNYQSLTFLRASDRTWGQTANWSGFLNDELGAAGRMFLHQGLLFVQGTAGSLWGFDPDNATAGWTRCTVTGGPLPVGANDRQYNLFVYYPPSGKYYSHNPFTYNPILHRLTPPSTNPLTNAWTFDTITLDTDLPDTQPGGDVNPCTLLHYVPSIQCLSWPGKVDETGGNVYIIKPE
jgi:hypothetical protein